MQEWLRTFHGTNAPFPALEIAVKVALTADDGTVPLNTPVELKVSQDGKPVADQVLTPVPPSAASVWL